MCFLRRPVTAAFGIEHRFIDRDLDDLDRAYMITDPKGRAGAH
ncbi:hypothetical protein [Methylobacterium nigriterrae]